MTKLFKLLKPQNAKLVPGLLAWELFSEVGLRGSFSRPRKIRGAVESKFARLYKKRDEGFYSRYDWMRFELALLFFQGKSLLDIGPYTGALMEMASRLGFPKIVGLDIHRHSGLSLPPGAEFELCDVTNMKFATSSFDTICALEIIEHLPVESVVPAIEKIREVAKGRIIYSLPFKEKFPLFKQEDPTGHKQSFDEAKIFRLFPKAYFTLAEAGLGAPWIIIIEDAVRPAKTREFKLSSAKIILRALNP